MSEVSEIRTSVETALQRIDQLVAEMQKQRTQLKAEFDKRMETLRFAQINPEELETFFEEPYVIIPTRRPEQWYVISPRWLNFHIGWLERQTKGYNIFIVNKIVNMFSELPQALRDKFRFKKPLPYKVQDGMLLTGADLQERAWQSYRKFLQRREGKDQIRIKKGYEFNLIAQMIEDGTLPFMPQPIDKDDLREYSEIKLRPYQKDAWQTFLERGATGVFWAFGSGKSFYGLYALGSLKGRKLVVVPSITLKEQWYERIEKYLSEVQHEIEVQTYHSYHKVRDKAYTVILFDECQHLPANTFIRLATLRAKYRMGFSGSPYREDGRESYIIALTGFPIGLAWEKLLDLQVVKEPTFRVYILKNHDAKLRKLDDLLKLPLKTIIFCDWVKLGKRIANKHDIPFIYGQTKDRLTKLRTSQVCVVSRVGDEGMSLPNIERVIEIAFLFGSRMQESQRFGRLMHATKEEPEHIILFTEKEYNAYQKRLLAISERGFRIEYIR